MGLTYDFDWLVTFGLKGVDVTNSNTGGLFPPGVHRKQTRNHVQRASLYAVFPAESPHDYN